MSSHSTTLTVHPDLVLERSKASFNVNKLQVELAGGPAQHARRKELYSILESLPALQNKPKKYFLSRSDLFDRGLTIIRDLYELKARENLSDEEMLTIFFMIGEDLPMQLQIMVFLPCLKSLASDEQLKEWLPRAQRYEMIGSYAQTELSHGSNVAALETEAKYDPVTDEFIINTPSLQATKWWIGQLGKIANHTVLFARLLVPEGQTADGKVKYKDYGPHPFLVPVRSYDTHKPFDGVTVGDIGPKMGAQTFDNGYISFRNYRIPRFNMLSRYAKINPSTKKYEPPANPKLLYGSMLAVRCGIVSFTTYALQACSTIAIRYAATRRQFQAADASKSDPELQILDYVSQQHRILPHLAAAYATHFVGKWMVRQFQKMNADFAQGDLSLLPAMHATSSGLKALMTVIGCEALESCRQSCGGHGYSLFSAFPGMYTTFTHLATAEGENFLLNQQLVRALLKNVQIANTMSFDAASKLLHPLDPAIYLLKHTAQVTMTEKSKVQTTEDWLNHDVILEAMEHRAARLLGTIALNLQELLGSMSPADAWNQQTIDINAASRAHGMVIITKVFMDEVKALSHSSTVGSSEVAILQKLVTLFALFFIEKDVGHFTEDQYVNANQAGYLRKALRIALSQVREQAIPLVDAFGVPDSTLNSALGRYDGRTYETMYKWATELEPLNQQVVWPGVAKHILPLVHKHRAKL